jgi:pyruvate dehydrogenase (quinone)
MSKTVSDFIVERLHAWGVRRFFGDGINRVFGALNRASDDPERRIAFIQARHEEMAAFMASAFAKFTGELGVCICHLRPRRGYMKEEVRSYKAPPALALTGMRRIDRVDRSLLHGGGVADRDHS